MNETRHTFLKKRLIMWTVVFICKSSCLGCWCSGCICQIVLVWHFCPNSSDFMWISKNAATQRIVSISYGYVFMYCVTSLFKKKKFHTYYINFLNMKKKKVFIAISPDWCINIKVQKNFQSSCDIFVAFLFRLNCLKTLDGSLRKKVLCPPHLNLFNLLFFLNHHCS